MSIIDSDLLSIQQARIILEEALTAKSSLNELPCNISQDYLRLVVKYFESNIENIIEQANFESNYGTSKDELILAKYYLANFQKDLDKYPKIGQVVKGQYEENITGRPKGICLSILPAYLPIVVTMQNIILAIHTRNPIILIPNERCKNQIIKIIDDLQEIALNNYYPKAAISVLKYLSKKGEEELYRSNDINFVIENRLCENSRYDGKVSADWFSASIGNNIVFIEKTANIAKAAKDIVRSKAFNNGLLPGIEQAVVVESPVYVAFKLALEKEGAYFLDKEQQGKIEKAIYDSYFMPRKELIGKSAYEIAKIAEIELPSDTQILVVTKPYVSMNSPYSREKYHPILSLYIEDDWRHACEKCIELILNDQKGQSLSIYTSDSYVIEQFIEKKPVSRVLVNTSTGFGSIGIGSDLPLSFCLSTKQSAGVSCKSLIPAHFMFFREIGTSIEDPNSILTRYSFNERKCTQSLFEQTINNSIEN